MELKIGDRVQILNTGGAYTTYEEWFEKNAPQYLDSYDGECVYMSDKGTVVARANHTRSNKTPLVAIRPDGRSEIVLMAEQECYLKLVEEENTIKNVVYVEFESGGKGYLYEVPSTVKLNKGDIVYVNVYKTEKRVTCITDSFEIPEDALNCMISELFDGEYSNLSKLVGMMVKF